MLLRLWIALLACLAAAPCRAEVSLVSVDKGQAIISVSGEIHQDDFHKFERIANTQPNGVVALQGPGGMVGPALGIGALIRSKGYVTIAVGPCASACGFIWLAGTKRYIDRRGRVGFHAAYTTVGTENRPSGVGNAIAGAYMSELHLSLAAIEFVMTASPDAIQWLTPGDAERIGIAYSATDLDPDKSNEPGTPSLTKEQRALLVLDRYYAEWMKGGPQIEALGSFYPDTVTFYGATIPRERVMEEKRKFASRWPDRQFSFEKSTLFVQCAPDHCAVTGVLHWSVSSVERGVRSTGSANFVMKIAHDPSAGREVITSENGILLTTRQEILPTTPPAVVSTVPSSDSPAFAEGRRARIAYEGWFGALPEGLFKAGAGWWAANRSLKPAPSCDQPRVDPAWIAGCAADAARLAEADRRRLSEPDFRAGWNSL